jgi:protein-L-isoaspartate(D-aspartate) O-methyltransferase
MRFVYTLRSRGVTDPRVLTAMERIDRGAFVRGLFAERAYEDMPLPIACGQTISQPSVVALMTRRLRSGERDKVLEVGTGSGYQAAILSELARRVYTVERHRRLVREARRSSARSAHEHHRAGRTARTACPNRRPSTASWSPPPPRTRPGRFWRSCARAASWCCPVGQSDNVQTLIKVRRTARGFDYEELRPVRFVPLLEGMGKDCAE